MSFSGLFFKFITSPCFSNQRISKSINARRADSAKRTVRYAVVGLGYIAQSAALPAFAHAENSELVALVSDDPKKLKQLGRRYHVADTYSYAEFDECLASGIDAAALDAGPDGVDGTGDDGRFPFPPGHANEFPTGDYEFEVGVRHLGDGQIELVSRAVGPRNIARTVRAVVELPTALGAPPEVLGWQEIR